MDLVSVPGQYMDLPWTRALISWGSVKNGLFLAVVGIWMDRSHGTCRELPASRADRRPIRLPPSRRTGRFSIGYCVSCHNQRGKIGKDTNVMLDVLDPGKVADGAEAWEKVVRKLRARAMPPQGARGPTRRPTSA